MGSPVRRVVAGIAAVAVAMLAAGEIVNRVAARRGLGGAARPGRSAVVVLGYRNAAPTANLVNRWRVRAGLATAERLDADVIVFSGGSPGGRCEADVMADFARELGCRRRIARERASRSTAENIALSLPALEGATRIALVSNPPHAARARAELRRQRPDLAERVVAGADVRPGAWIVLLPAAALYELMILARQRMRARR